MNFTHIYHSHTLPRLLTWLFLLFAATFALPAYAQSPDEPLTTTVEYDAESGTYTKVTRLGDMVVNREYMTFEEYQEYQMNELMKSYWHERSATGDTATGDGLLSKIPGFSEISKKIDGLLAIPDISINPTGSADLTFQIVNDFRDDKNIDPENRSQTRFDFDENIQINLNAKIGDLFDFDINWNTMATFDFENKLKFGYTGKEDEILQLFEAGNISFPLTSTLIQGSQELFGIHTKLKFGKLTVDAVVSKKETSTENMQIQGGASTQEFQIRADEYEENRHYFLSQYFYDNYNKAMSTLPTPNTNIRIIRLEVWRTNVGAAVTNNRNILALTDLGESNPSSNLVTGGVQTKPSNTSNNLLNIINTSAIRVTDNITSYMQGMGFTGGTDYEKVESARLLNSSEYTYNEQLGFITLSQPLSADQVLAVAFQYQVIGDTTVYQVGELTTDGVNDPNTLVVKLIKGTGNNTHSPLWRLMMKNVYFLRSTQIGQDNFRLNVLYESRDGGVGIGYFTDGPKEGIPLIELFGLDRMDASQNYYYADGVFDWFDSAAFKGGIIQASTGRIFFPYVEPFGKDLRQILGDDDFAKEYCFDSLYTMTRSLAQQYADKNKFYLEGYFSSTVSGEISLGYSVSQGSVTVTAGGIPLIENVDYTVDYTMGTVRIINESILSSGTPISVSSENNSFSMMSKRMLGTHLNYEIQPDFNIGGTFMNLYEKPLTQKNNFGEEPTSNSIWGLDLNYRHEAPFITKFVDLLPGIDTKEPSNLSVSAEFAQFIPGLANIGTKEGTVTYIDDFEGAESNIDLKGFTYWNLASTPQDYRLSMPMFPETAPNTGLAYGFNRAKLAWYRISDIFYNTNCPNNITADDRSQPYTRRIYEQEVFPNKQLAMGELTMIYELNLAYYPEERGPYNYDVAPTEFSAGLTADGKLARPRSRWGGIMRKLDNTNFENSNVEYLEFWLMDPFIYDDMNTTNGKLVFNLGNVSEDVLKDGRKSFENGLPTTNNNTAIDTTIWGRVPRLTALTSSFDNANLEQQDLGLDGLSDEEEKLFASSYGKYYREINSKVASSTKQKWDESAFSPLNDPAGDNYHYYRGSDYDDREANIFDRYKYYNGTQGNSTASQDKYTSSATTTPDAEDLNGDNTLNESEQYYEYIVNIEKDIFQNEALWEENYITNMVKTKVDLKNGDKEDVKWYQFRIPVKASGKRAEGGISDFRSIRYIRMYMTGFQEEEHLRFGELQLVRTDWRIYEKNDRLVDNSIYAKLQGTGKIDISSVCYENDKRKKPVGYTLPPGIDRTIDPSQSQLTEENEQAMVLKIDSLESNDARAVYKTSTLDTRQYKRFKMFVHAEEFIDGEKIPDNRLYAFVRFGSDFTENYYEYKIPLKITQPGAISDREVWPAENNFDFAFEQLTNLKLERDKRKTAGQAKYNEVYTKMDGHNTMSVIGSPSFGDITSLMIGIINEDDVTHNAEIWVNEMRMSGYDEDGGWAAVANLGIVFSDLGSFTLGGQIETVGFGNIEDNIMDRNQDDFYEYNLAAAIQLGKFFPDKAKVNMPFSYTRTHQRTSPKYDPMNTDVELSKTLDNYDSDAIKDSIKEMSQTNKVYKSYALNNVRVGITSKNPMPYDPANFSFSLGYNESNEVNPEIEYERIKNYKGTFNYIYSINPKPVEPFKKAKAFKSQYLKLIRDFNFYYVPRNISFGTSMTRYYEESQLRDNMEPIIKDTTFQYMTYDKNWQWDRTSDIKWDLTRSLKLSFTSATNSEIAEIIRTDESDGDRLVNIPVNKEYLEDIGYFDWYDKWKDTVWKSIKHFGEPVSYEQKFNISYSLPINKLPHLDWITSNAQYSAYYQWDKGTVLTLGESPITGNIIENQRNWSGDIRFNFETFYNKFPHLKEINKKYSKNNNSSKKSKKAEKSKENKDDKPKTYERKNLRLKAGSKTRINHRLNSMKVDVVLKDTSGKDVPVKISTVDANTITLLSKTDLNDLSMIITANNKGDNGMSKVLDYSARFLMMIRNVSFNYRHGDVMEINGYKPTSGFLGQDFDNPGYDFTFGFFNADKFIHRAYGRDSLLMTDEGITTPIVRSITQNLTAKALIEPLPNLKIDFNASWMKNNQDDIYYMYGYSDDWNMKEFAGTFSRTCLPIRTSFLKNSANSELFETFLRNRKVVQGRILKEVGTMNSNGKANYVNPSGADVLVPAFYATYMKKSASDVDLNFIPSGSFKSMITSLIPNWKVTCDALMRIEGIKKTFKSFNLNHAYKSTYEIGPYRSLLEWKDNIYGSDQYGTCGEYEDFNNVSSQYDVTSVSINEQFSPLFGVDASLKNSLSMKFEFKRSRNAQLDIPGNQILESSSKELVIGSGYRFDDIGMIINLGKQQKKIKNDLNVRGDLSFKNTDAFIRIIDEAYSQLSSGLRALSLKLSADYVFSERLNIKIYYDCKSSTPKVSEGFPIITSDFGIAFKINLTR